MSYPPLRVRTIGSLGAASPLKIGDLCYHRTQPRYDARWFRQHAAVLAGITAIFKGDEKFQLLMLIPSTP
jgi:hypothetical protein